MAAGDSGEHAPLQRPTSSEAPLLAAPGEGRDRLIRAYYACLNEDDEFAAALRELFADLTRILGDEPDPKSLLFAPQRRRDRRRQEVDAALVAFIERWPLPHAHIVEDLRWAYLYRQRRGSRLLASMRVYPLAPGRTIVGVDMGQVIVPPAFEPFDYDPAMESRASLDARIKAMCRRLRQSILSQAEHLETEAEAAGFAALPPAYRGPRAQTRTAAQRLYLRVRRPPAWANAAALSWAEIAEWTPSSRFGKVVHRTSVKGQVERAAMLLGITLPLSAN